MLEATEPKTTITGRQAEATGAQQSRNVIYREGMDKTYCPPLASAYKDFQGKHCRWISLSTGMLFQASTQLQQNKHTKGTILFPDLDMQKQATSVVCVCWCVCVCVCVVCVTQQAPF